MCDMMLNPVTVDGFRAAWFIKNKERKQAVLLLKSTKTNFRRYTSSSGKKLLHGSCTESINCYWASFHSLSKMCFLHCSLRKAENRGTPIFLNIQKVEKCFAGPDFLQAFRTWIGHHIQKASVLEKQLSGNADFFDDFFKFVFLSIRYFQKPNFCRNWARINETMEQLNNAYATFYEKSKVRPIFENLQKSCFRVLLNHFLKEFIGHFFQQIMF